MYSVTAGSSAAVLATIPTVCFLFFFFNDTATTEIYTLSLHDALPISDALGVVGGLLVAFDDGDGTPPLQPDRKSTRLNSSHSSISYAVFCLKKKKERRRLRPLSRIARVPAPAGPTPAAAGGRGAAGRG